MEEGLRTPSYKKKTLTELYEELCPMYMSFGMTYEQFWDQDATMVIAYRRLYERQQRQINWQAWLFGSYVYEAFAAVYSSVWSKNSNLSYPAKPRPLTEEDARREREEEQRLKMEKIFAYVAGKVKVQKEQEAQENG